MFYKQIASISLCLVIVHLYLINKLSLYVHPRYEIFSISLALIGAILLIISFKRESNKKEKLSISGFLVIIVALISLTFPPVSLSERTAQSRLQTSFINSANSSPSSFDSFSQDFTHFDIVDWSSLISSKPPEEQIVGKSAKLIGFIFVDGNENKYIARFKLSCCAVDATPIKIMLSKNDLSKSFIVGEWKQIEGKLILEDGQYKINVESAVTIPEPEQPYVY